jgi:hypothetical protein
VLYFIRLCGGLLVSLGLAVACAPSAPSAQGVSIRFEPGPYGSDRIVTPWGDFDAVYEGDTIWVGPEKDYVNSVVHAISEQDGFRELCAGGGRSCNTFVEADLPTARVGDNQLAGVTIDTLFGVGADRSIGRAAKPSDTEYVDITWEQAEHTAVRPLILDRESHKSYAPRNCGTDVGIHHCEFVYRDDALVHQADVVFISAKAAPGVVAGKSIARMSYDTLAEHVRDLAKSGINVDPNDPDDDSYRNAAHLHAIDGSIPATPMDVAVAPKGPRVGAELGGYSWAKGIRLTDPERCTHFDQQFEVGCEAWVREQADH